MKTLLVELFTEELPPKALPKLGAAFAGSIEQGLRKRGLLSDASRATSFATPRRLAVAISEVRTQGADEQVTRKLMPVSVGLDAEGKPTAALQKKLSALGHADFDVAQLQREGEGKAAQLLLVELARGQSLQVALQSALEEAIAALPVPKVMSYQLADGQTTVQFVRPVHGLVALHGEDVVNVNALGHAAGSLTHGHRFQGAAAISLANAEEYEARLENEGQVIASFEKRRHEIERLLFTRAEQCGDTLGDRADYEALLDEVTALVEMPTVYVGQFEAEFLEVPAECLILTMKLNQKYFPMFLSEGGLSSRFLIVSNMRLDDPRNVIEGNQRVVRPRLSDARFFFNTDKKTTLEARLPKLDAVVYHNKLGSQGERSRRVVAIATLVAHYVQRDDAYQTKVQLAARLAKADLLTDMVGEFPELQGTMGKYYARAEGIDDEVAVAIEDHYKPRFAGDALPRNPVGLAVSLADKLETLVGLFGIGQLPTGDKDPFALRRHALGVIRMLVEREVAVDLSELLRLSAHNFGTQITDPTDALRAFIFDRFAGSLRDQGYTSQEVDAVLSQHPERLADVSARLAAVHAFSALPEAQALAAANKRIGNILKKADSVPASFDAAVLVDAAERALADAMALVLPAASTQFTAGDYTASLLTLAALRTPVDKFFDEVMVNADDPAVRANRLGLLATLHREMNRVADLSKLAT